MKCVAHSTEDRVKQAATKVFLEKGFDGTTTRDIAREAGLNSALVNYYFRSKEKLFAAVFNDMLRLFFQGLNDIINQPISLRDKIGAMIEHDFRMFKEHNNLSNFVINEIHRDSSPFLNSFPSDTLIHGSLFHQQLQAGIDAGIIRPVDIKSVLMLMIANVQFIFQCKIMTSRIHSLTETEFDAFAESHKQLVIDMIINYLFWENKPAVSDAISLNQLTSA